MNTDQDIQDLTVTELSARRRTLRRMQKVGKLLLANGPGDFYGKKKAAELGKTLGLQRLAERFEILRQAFRRNFEPILMEMYQDPSKPLPWFIGWDRSCEKDDHFEFAVAHFVTLASRDVHFYEQMGFERGIDLNSEAEIILAALEFETPSRTALEANTEKALDDFARSYGFRAAEKAAKVLRRAPRPISAAFPNGLQEFFLRYWDDFPRLETGELMVGANGAICPPLCYFDDKSTEQVVQVFARRSSNLACKTEGLGVDAINKTWRRLGLVRVRRPLFCTKPSKVAKAGGKQNLWTKHVGVERPTTVIGNGGDV